LGGKEWHLLTHEELFKDLDTSLNGISAAEAQKRLAIYGPNAITPPKTRHWFVKFLLNLVGGFQLMLWFGSVLCFVVFGLTNATDVQTLALAVVLILVIFVTTIFQSIQEGKSDQVMEKLRLLSPTSVFCYRDGDLKEIPAVGTTTTTILLLLIILTSNLSLYVTTRSCTWRYCQSHRRREGSSGRESFK